MLKHLNKNILKNWKIYALFIIVMFEAAFLAKGELLKLDNYSIDELAAQTLDKCAERSYRPTCYDEEIPKLMDKISMEEAFQVASVVQGQDDSYGYCHVLGHELSAKEAAKDIDDWTSVLKRCPSGICSNGCLHGAAQERFRNEILDDNQLKQALVELESVCDTDDSWILSGLEQSECYHGLGHMAVYITGADILKSIDVCEKVGMTGKIDNRKLCFEGLFMQLFQPVDAEDEDLVKGLAPKKENLRAFCEDFGKEMVVEACWQEGFPLFKPGVLTSQGTVDFCGESTSASSEKNCYNMLFYVKAQSSNYDEAKLLDYCQGMPGDMKARCFGSAANAIMHGGYKYIERAANFCGMADKYGEKDSCYKFVLDYSGYNLKKGSEAFNKLCSSMPMPYREECMKINLN